MFWDYGCGNDDGWVWFGFIGDDCVGGCLIVKYIGLGWWGFSGFVGLVGLIGGGFVWCVWYLSLGRC